MLSILSKLFAKFNNLIRLKNKIKKKKKSYFDINKALIDIKSQILYLHKVEISQVDEYVCPFRIIYLVNYFITNAKKKYYFVSCSCFNLSFCLQSSCLIATYKVNFSTSFSNVEGNAFSNSTVPASD